MIACWALAVAASCVSADPVSRSALGSWDHIAPSPLSPREWHVAVWTGSEMIIWGGRALLELEPGDDRVPTGYSYDPRTGKETPILEEVYRDGAAYDPKADSWQKLPPAPIEEGYVQKAAWTGRELLLWLRNDQNRLVGAAFDPATDSWRTLPFHPFGEAFAYATVWTGREMIIAAGIDYSGRRPPRGAAYDPVADTWRELPPSPLAPPDWTNGVWAGKEMVIWGGGGACEGCPPWSGGFAHDPASDSWRELPEAPIEGRADFQATWTGRELVIWGGQAGPSGRADGASYVPADNNWGQISRSPLDARYWAAHVWTGREVIIWGGYNAYAPEESRRVFADGAAYDPAADAWTMLAAAPLGPRCGHSAVWTGSHVIVWGGTEHCGSVGPRLANGAALEVRP